MAIAKKIRELKTQRRCSWRFGGTEVVIVADERLNRRLVQGSRIDRETIEGLIRVLDTEEGMQKTNAARVDEARQTHPQIELAPPPRTGPAGQ